MMFIYPSMIALSAIALHHLAGIGKKRISTVVVGILVLAGLIHPLRHTIKNHPNTYIYFNEWSGGINKTYGKFETDYYANSLKPASEYFPWPLAFPPMKSCVQISQLQTAFSFRKISDCAEY